MIGRRTWPGSTSTSTSRATGLRTVLDAIEQVQNAHGRGRTGTRSATTPGCTPTTCNRFVDLGIMANDAHVGHRLRRRDDGRRTPRAWASTPRPHPRSMPYGDLAGSGAVVTYGADCPGVRIERSLPLDADRGGRHAASSRVTRRTARTLPDQRVSVHDAVRAYTANGAYQLHLEDEIGTIEVGKKADPSRSAPTCSPCPTTIHDVPVTATLFGGRLTHDAALTGPRRGEHGERAARLPQNRSDIVGRSGDGRTGRKCSGEEAVAAGTFAHRRPRGRPSPTRRTPRTSRWFGWARAQHRPEPRSARHFASKDQLLLAMADVLLEETYAAYVEGDEPEPRTCAGWPGRCAAPTCAGRRWPA